MESIANAVLAVAIIAAFGTWIHALINWDGKRPCKPEDCEDCPYNGTGCKPEDSPKADQ